MYTVMSSNIKYISRYIHLPLTTEKVSNIQIMKLLKEYP